jgi:hypothetical protein
MRPLVSILCFVILFWGCANSDTKRNGLDQDQFIRVTTVEDSIEQKFVIYRSIQDTAITYLKQYWDNGAVQAVSFFNGGKMHGLRRQYFDNGQLAFEGQFVENLKTGDHKFYFANSKLMKIEHYDTGKKAGVWYYYDSAGLMVDKEVY